MDRIWQRLWDRHGARYSWLIWVVAIALLLPTYLVYSLAVIAFEGSSRYLEAAVFITLAMAALMLVVVLPGGRRLHLAELSAAGREINKVAALQDTYVWARVAVVRALGAMPVWSLFAWLAVGVIAGASGSRLIQYGIAGVATGLAAALIGVHAFFEGAVRPARAALAGDTEIGDALPRSRPTFTGWLKLALLGSFFVFSFSSAMLAVVLDQVRESPVLWVVIGVVLTVSFGVPTTLGAIVSPSLTPIRDLAEATERVGAGDYTKRLSVVQDDDLGALAASFNRMQAGLAERQRLQAAFGTYVDPALAARLLEQGDDIFTGERREVTVMFVDIRDFTPFAEANTAEDTVSRLNALFQIVVPAVVDAGGHVNKFLGDGALAVFGAPNELAQHADAAVGAAVLIQRLVAERFGGALRIGIGINTGVVIAGTIGGGGKLEFTLIGDTVNVAARVEQLTKTTGDTILLTQSVFEALASSPARLIDRGIHPVKGKSAALHVFGLTPA
jgi:class 3 adenylate cyclase